MYLFSRDVSVFVGIYLLFLILVLLAHPHLKIRPNILNDIIDVIHSHPSSFLFWSIV